MTIIVPIAVLAAISLVGAGVAAVRAAAAETHGAQQIVLWVMTAILGAFGVLSAAAAYWLWRFSVEFRF